MKPKTLFLDIDGTLIFHHNKFLTKQLYTNILNGTIDKFTEWDKKGYNIILVTGRRESMREQTEKQLTEMGLFWDQLVMGIGGGDRIIINDRKPDSENDTCYAINIDRNVGIGEITI